MAYHYDSIQSNYRCILATWSLSMIVLLNAYRTVLFAILTVPHYYGLLQDVNELANRTKINVWVLKESSVEELFLV